MIERHIDRIRQNPHFGTHVPIWVIPENNLGLESSHIEDFVIHLRNVHVFHENDEERSGVRKTQQNTDDYQILVESMLMKRRISFDKHAFTVSKGWAKPNGDMSGIKMELRNQLERYHWEVKQARDSFGKRRITMTGKMGGAQDDLYVALAMLAFWPLAMRREARLFVGVNQPPSSYDAQESEPKRRRIIA